MPTMVTDIFNSFFSSIDNVLYRLIQILISIFDYIADVPLFSEGVLEKFYDRVFYFVSIVMIFKVTFSVIQYILNPDQFANGERGFGKVIQGILFALVGLVVVKPIFGIAKDVQNKVLEKNVIPSLILGIDGGSEDEENVTSRIPFYLAQAFVFPNKEFQNPTDSMSKFETYESNGRAMGVGTAYKIATDKDNPNFSLLLSLVNAKNDVEGGNADRYIFEYRPIVSTACAIFVVIMYLNFCIDLAIRVVKLGFLQIVAPIPIISMVDPKSAKSGMMSKWFKNCLSTYAGLFIRIAAVSFVIFGIRTLMETMDANMNEEAGLYKNIVIIFGLLMFAKDLPKLISDITGIDLKGDFKINPLKRVTDNAVMKPVVTAGSAVAGGAIGATGGLAANAIALRNNWGSMKGHPGQKISSIFGLGTGAISAGVRGTFSKEKGVLKKANAGIKGSVEARNLRDARAVENIGGPSGAFNRAVTNVHNWAGVEEGATAYDKELTALSQMETQANDILTRANGEMIKYEKLQFVDKDKKTKTMADFKRDKEELTLLRNMDVSTFEDDLNARGQVIKSKDDKIREHAAKINDLQTSIAINEKFAEQAYVDAVMSGKLVDNSGNSATDVVTIHKVNGLRDSAQKSSYKNISTVPITNGAELKKFKDTMLQEQARIKNSDAYKQALVNKKDAAASKK